MKEVVVRLAVSSASGVASCLAVAESGAYYEDSRPSFSVKGAIFCHEKGKQTNGKMA